MSAATKLQRYSVSFHGLLLPSDKRFGLQGPDPVLRKIDYATDRGVCLSGDVAEIEADSDALRRENTALRKHLEGIVNSFSEGAQDELDDKVMYAADWLGTHPTESGVQS